MPVLALPLSSPNPSRSLRFLFLSSPSLSLLPHGILPPCPYLSGNSYIPGLNQAGTSGECPEQNGTIVCVLLSLSPLSLYLSLSVRLIVNADARSMVAFNQPRSDLMRAILSGLLVRAGRLLKNVI